MYPGVKLQEDDEPKPPVDNGDSAHNPGEPSVRHLPLRYIQVISSPDEPATTSRETKDDEARAGTGWPGAQTTRRDDLPGSDGSYSKRLQTQR